MSFAYTTHILLFSFPLRTGDITSNKRSLPIHFPDAVSINFAVSKGRMPIYYCRAKIFRVIINSLAPWFLGPYLISAKLECMQIICSNTMCSQLAIIRIRWSVSGNFNKRVSFLSFAQNCQFALELAYLLASLCQFNSLRLNHFSLLHFITRTVNQSEMFWQICVLGNWTLIAAISLQTL